MNVPNNPMLVLVRGLPGSGKTYFSEKLVEAISKNNEIVSLDPDATDYDSVAYKNHVQKQNEDGVDPKLHAYRFLREQAYKGIEDHKIIVWNQPFTNLEILQKITKRLQDHSAENSTTLSIIILEVMIDPNVAWQRVEDRKKLGGHGPSESTFSRFVNDYSSCAPLGYNTIEINGEEQPEQYIDKIVPEILSLRLS